MISSSWRYAFTLDELRNMFFGNLDGKMQTTSLLGVTPKLDSGHRGR